MTARTGAITSIATGGYGGRANSLRPASGQLSGVAALSAAGSLSGPVKLLMHFNGANASTTFIDSSYGAHSVTPNGAAQLSTAQELFGTASGYFGTSSDYLTLDSATDFTFGTGDFTLDFWVMRDSTTVPVTFIDFTDPSTPNAPKIYYDAGTLRYACMGADKITATVTLSINTGYRISVARAGIATRMFLNGTQVGSTYTASDNLPCAAAGPVIGAAALQLDAATTAWAAAVVAAGGTVSTPRKVLVDALVVGLKTDGVWTILDHLWIPAAENTQSALIDLVALTQASAVNSPTFTTDVGYTGDGSTSYIDTTFDPTVGGTHNFVVNSAMMAVWNNTSRSYDNTSITGTYDGTTVADLLTHTGAWGVHGFGMRVNDASTSTFPIAGACTGFYLGQRTSSSLLQGVLNGVSLGTISIASVAINNQNSRFFIGGRCDGNGTGGLAVGTTDQFSVAAYGGALTTTQATNFSYRVMTYLDGIGLFLNRWVAAVVAAGGTVSSGRKTIVGNLISGLIADGLWGKFDRLWILAAENSQSALVDLVANISATAVSSPTFTADTGYFCGSGYIDTGFVTNTDGVQFTLNTAHISHWSATDGQNGAPGVTVQSLGNTHIYNRYSDDNCYLRINNGGGGSTANIDGAGFVLAVRTAASGAGAIMGYRDGFNILSDSTGTSALDVGVSWQVYQRQSLATSIGGSMTSTDATNYYNRLLTYMNAIGALLNIWVGAVVAAGGTVSSGRKTIVQALITGLITDGVWQKLDRLWLFAGENSQSALVDLKGLVLATAVNTPTFTTDRGYAVSGTSYIATGYGGFYGGQYQIDSASFGDWIMTAGTGGANAIFMGTLGSKNSFLALDGSSNYGVVINDNSGTYLSASTAGTSTGFVIGSRTSSTQIDIYYNGSNVGSGSHVDAQPFQPTFLIGCRNNNGGPDAGNPHSSSAAFIGSGLTGTDASNFYLRLRTYMTAVGVP